jgi:hypothetical protein
MAGNSKPRKKRTRRATPAIPVLIATDPEQNRNLKLIPHQELAEIREGRGTETSWHTVTARLNFGSVLAMRHEFSEDPKPVMRAALDAVRALKARHESSGRYVLTGDELRAIGAGLTMTDDLQDATTRRQHRDALRIVMAAATE